MGVAESGTLCVAVNHRTDKLCVRWPAGATVGTLLAALSTLSGWKRPVELKAKGFWRNLITRRRTFNRETRLEKIAKTPLEASGKVRAVVLFPF